MFVVRNARLVHMVDNLIIICELIAHTVWDPRRLITL
jgi:hypothetical protein